MRDFLRGLPVFAGDLPSFDPATAAPDPTSQFGSWLTAALTAGVPEPHAMTLSTVDEHGRPSSRTLILKNLDADSWQFSTGATSRKGRELAAQPWAALSFYWPQMGRQVRVRGAVRPMPAEDSARDFLARSLPARAETLLALQSQTIDDDTDLALLEREALARLRDDPTAVAPQWTLYGLDADEVEFWQADKERRHVRLHYLRDDTGWRTERLWP